MGQRKETIERNQLYTQTLEEQDGKLYSETIFHDKKVLDRIHDLRNSKVMEKAKMSLHDGEDIRGIISVPDPLQWSLFKKEYSEVYSLLTSKLESDRTKGMKQIEILKPEWIVMVRF